MQNINHGASVFITFITDKFKFNSLKEPSRMPKDTRAKATCSGQAQALMGSVLEKSSALMNSVKKKKISTSLAQP